MAVRMRRQVREQLMQRAVTLREQGLNQREVALMLDVSQPTVCMWFKKLAEEPLVTPGRIAGLIRAELVCCDIYERMQPLGSEAAINVEVLRQDHIICFYGEWAARIAEQVK